MGKQEWYVEVKAEAGWTETIGPLYEDQTERILLAKRQEYCGRDCLIYKYRKAA